MGIEKDEGKNKREKKNCSLDGGENIGDFVGLGESTKILTLQLERL